MSEHTPTTMGIDISDRMSTVCVLAGDGEVMEESRFRSTRAGLGRYLEHRAPMRVVLEVGTHSPWMSRQIEELGHEVFVANPRQLRLIYQSDRKCDAVDAEALARLAREDVPDEVAQAGADVFVAGSAIFKSKDYAQTIEFLRKKAEG